MNNLDVDEKQIIRQISHIQFPCLQLLSLYKNNIESVEGLARVELSNMNSFGIGKPHETQDKTIYITSGSSRNVDGHFYQHYTSVVQ